MDRVTESSDTVIDAATLTSRAEEFALRMSKLETERSDLASELTQAIYDRVIELYATRSDRSMSFELWLTHQFVGSPHRRLFQADEKLRGLSELIDLTQVRYFGKLRIAREANKLLWSTGHEYGFNDFFGNVRIMGRRLGRRWKGNLPRN